MSESISSDMPGALRIAAGADRFGEQRGLSSSTIAFKVTTPKPGVLFIYQVSLALFYGQLFREQWDITSLF